MSTEQHEALKLADAIEAGCPYDEGKCVETIRVSHALIVQMAEALGKCRFDSLNMKLADFKKICDAHAAATQYLNPKGPKT